MHAKLYCIRLFTRVGFVGRIKLTFSWCHKDCIGMRGRSIVGFRTMEGKIEKKTDKKTKAEMIQGFEVS